MLGAEIGAARLLDPEGCLRPPYHHCVPHEDTCNSDRLSCKGERRCMVTRNNTDHKMRLRYHGRAKVRDGSLLGGLVPKEGNWNRLKQAQDELFPCGKTISAYIFLLIHYYNNINNNNNNNTGWSKSLCTWRLQYKNKNTQNYSILNNFNHLPW